MINKHAQDLVDKATFSKNFCRPLYDSYCFSALPGTIKKLLGINGDFSALPAQAVGGSYQPYDVVYLFFVDGFGWKFFERYAEKYPFLKRFIDEGIASKITSQFPSTTAAHVTCMNTGLPVGQSGVYEWFYYEPKVDRVIAPLLYSFAGDGRVESLKQANISPLDIYPNTTLYQELHQNGAASFVMQHYTIANSTYSQTMFRGAKSLPYRQIKQGLQNAVEICSEAQAGTPHYVYLYFGDIDSQGHRHGIDSPEFEQAVDYFWKEMEESFWKKLEYGKRKVAFAVIADHGMVPVNPKTTMYLNKVMPIEKHLKRNRSDKLIAPAGSCRDFFLHVKDEQLHETKELLTKFLAGQAEVYLTEELIAQRFFGQLPPSEAFLSRVGNLVILPYEGEAVWWYEKNRFEQHFFAAHGGLTRGELEIPFLFLG